MYCTIKKLKEYCNDENTGVWIKNINENNDDFAFEIENIKIDKYGDLILEFNPEHLIN